MEMPILDTINVNRGTSYPMYRSVSATHMVNANPGWWAVLKDEENGGEHFFPVAVWILYQYAEEEDDREDKSLLQSVGSIDLVVEGGLHPFFEGYSNFLRYEYDPTRSPPKRNVDQD